jgi:hypothetical protein
VRAAVLGNAGAMLVFRVSGADAELLVPEFDPLPASELVDGRRSVRGCAAVSGMNMSNCCRGFIRRPAVSMQCGRRADGILDGREAL